MSINPKSSPADWSKNCGIYGKSTKFGTKLENHLLNMISIIIHQTHYEKSDWSRAFSQFTKACELDVINAISAADLHLSCQVQTVCLVTKPLGVFSSETKWLLFLRMNYVKNV